MGHKDILRLHAYIILRDVHIQTRRQAPPASALEMQSGEKDRLAVLPALLEGCFYIQIAKYYMPLTTRRAPGRS
jgi:hypothetical protein